MTRPEAPKAPPWYKWLNEENVAKMKLAVLILFVMLTVGIVAFTLSKLL
ncbi:MAG: hypothetical protein JNK29_00650 [Anaerolineales bacterium]|nr:hypothetical protein [Anaerolineales bacterium]